MKHSEITLLEAISMIDNFLPIKIYYNDEVIYNDYDSENIIEVLSDGTRICGEIFSPKEVIPSRIRNREKNIITSINIEFIQHHHSIVTLYGEHQN